MNEKVKTYTTEVTEEVLEWLNKYWEKGGKNEILNAYIKKKNYEEFEHKIINSYEIISEILGEKSTQDCLNSIIFNSPEVQELPFYVLSASDYYFYMINNKFYELDYIIRKEYIHRVLYIALEKIINDYEGEEK